MHCMILHFVCILAIVYIPPYFSMVVLRQLFSSLIDKPAVPLLLLGDFNGYMCPNLDKHPPIRVSPQFKGTMLKDLWGKQDGQTLGDVRTLQSVNCMSLSRIYLCFVTPNCVMHIPKMQYANRTVSDHSHVVVWLTARPSTTLPKAPRKLNPFWLNLFSDNLSIACRITEQFQIHAHFEVYKLYSAALKPQLLKVYRMAQRRGCLLDSMSIAHIVLIQKHGKPLTDPNRIQTIYLLPVDVKILAKCLALQLNKNITTIIHPDQSGFMPLKFTALNIRRVYLNMQMTTDNAGHHALLSLDANKAFDGVEWPYLQQTLRHFDFGDVFISWVQLLYHAPMVSIREGGRLLPAFRLGWGTRQGCPLSLLLFALAIEPLAAMIREDDEIKDFEYKELREKITIYADDMLFFLGDTETSVKKLMEVITTFGLHSGLTINWAKLNLMPLDAEVSPSLPSLCPVPVVQSFKYLGVYIAPNITEYCKLNIMPLLHRFKAKIVVWNKLWLSLTERANFIKMILMPQLIYLLHNSPVVIPLYIFRLVNIIFCTLLRKDKSQSIRLEQLQHAKDGGCIAILFGNLRGNILLGHLRAVLMLAILCPPLPLFHYEASYGNSGHIWRTGVCVF